MSLAHRVIPVLLARDRMLIKGKQFNSMRVVGNIQQAAEIHQAREVDEMIVIDVGATMCSRDPDYQMVYELTRKCFMPITVGGGVRNIDHVRALLSSGADKVLIGTWAMEEPGFVRKCANKFGSQAIVVAIDAVLENGRWFVTSYCGSRTHLYSAQAFALEMQEKGAGELVVGNIAHDGMMTGYDTRLIKHIANAVSIPVIANCGAGSYQHMTKALRAGASAVAAGALFQWTDCTPRGAVEYLGKKGWEVRL